MYKLLGAALATFGLMAGSAMASDITLSDAQMDVVTAAGPGDYSPYLDNVDQLKTRNQIFNANPLQWRLEAHDRQFNVIYRIIRDRNSIVSNAPRNYF